MKRLAYEARFSVREFRLSSGRRPRRPTACEGAGRYGASPGKAGLVITLWVALQVPHPASAEPAFGGNCLSCHSASQTNALYIIAEDATADPDESGTGAPDRGTLPVFQVFRG